jgi:YegS/Rv2252/BmrU family lipid kinase
MSRMLFIINPAAHGGTKASAWERFKSQWPDPINSEDIIFTERQGHAREIATSAEDYDILVAVGGDGTVGEVQSGIMDHREPRPKLAIVPGGTGNDIARNLGIRSVENSVAALQDDNTVTTDLLRIDCKTEEGPEYRYALLYSSIGFSGNEVAKPWMKRILGPKAGYYLAMIIETVVFHPPDLTVRWEEEEYNGRCWIVLVGNVERTAGGSMCIAPGARIDDGEFRVSIIPSQSKIKSMTKMMPKVASGAHVKEPGVSYFPAKKLEVDSNPPTAVDVDGDLFGKSPATITIYPRAAQVLSPGLPDVDTHLV